MSEARRSRVKYHDVGKLLESLSTNLIMRYLLLSVLDC